MRKLYFCVLRHSGSEEFTFFSHFFSNLQLQGMHFVWIFLNPVLGSRAFLPLTNGYLIRLLKFDIIPV